MKSPLQFSTLVPLLILLHITLGSLAPRLHAKKQDIAELDDIKIEPLRNVNQASKLRSKRQNNYNQWNRATQRQPSPAANTAANELNRDNNFGFDENAARRALGPAPPVATTPSTIAPRATTAATIATTTTTPSPYNYYTTQATNTQQPSYGRYPARNQYQQQPASWNSGYGGYDRYKGYSGYDYSHYRTSYKYDLHSRSN